MDKFDVRTLPIRKITLPPKVEHYPWLVFGIVWGACAAWTFMGLIG